MVTNIVYASNPNGLANSFAVKMHALSPESRQFAVACKFYDKVQNFVLTLLTHTNTHISPLDSYFHCCVSLFLFVSVSMCLFLILSLCLFLILFLFHVQPQELFFYNQFKDAVGEVIIMCIHSYKSNLSFYVLYVFIYKYRRSGF